MLVVLWPRFRENAYLNEVFRLNILIFYLYSILSTVLLSGL